MNKNNLWKSFVVPVLIVIITLLIIGGGIYIYKNKKVEAPIIVDETQQKTMIVKLYFPNRIFNPESFDCSLVYPVDRIIPYTQAVATVTLNELIKGPTIEEEKNGYFGIIPDGTKVNSIKILDGVLSVDFSKEAESGGGSCAQTAKVSSIIKTFKQFPTVKSVQLSVEGRTEDIFQP